jgi:hypothetical protein
MFGLGDRGGKGAGEHGLLEEGLGEDVVEQEMPEDECHTQLRLS